MIFPPDGMLSDEIRLPEFSLVVGVVHRPDTGLRVITWDGENFRHMSAAAARRLAKHLEETGELSPVVEAFNATADALEARMTLH